MAPPSPTPSPRNGPLFSSTIPIPAGPAVPALYGPEAIDPFLAVPPADGPASAFTLGDDPALSFSAPGDRRRLEELGRDFQAARDLVAAGRGAEAKAAFARAMASLEAPLDAGRAGSPTLAQSIAYGEELFREALFGSAAFVEPGEAPGILSRLNREIKALEARDDGDYSPDLLRAKLLKAFAIMQYTAGFSVQRIERYEEAEKLVRHVIMNTDDETADLRLSADVLLLELLARQTERAFHRGDVKARRHHRERLIKQADAVLDRYRDADPTVREIVARYELEVLRMLGRMQVWNVALARARKLSIGSYRDTGAVVDLLQDPLFAPFVSEDKSHLLTAQEVRRRAPYFKALLAKMQAALANARAASLKESMLWGGAAATTAFIADVGPDGQLDSILIPAIAAAAASVVNRLRNGWMSDEARSAGIVGLYEREWQESAKDVARLLLQGGLETGLWLAPTAVAGVAPEGIEIVGNTLSNAADLYGRFFSWMGNGIVSLGTPEPYQQLLTSLSSVGVEDAAEIAYRLYTVGAGVQYISFLLFPKLRPFLYKTAKYFIPGAVMLGADLGMAIAGTDDYLSRIGRSSIGVFTGLSMLLAAGVIALAKSGSVSEATKSMWEGIRKADHNALVAIALTVGVSSAMGGLMQRGTRPDDPALMAILGASTVVGLLPIVLGISGVMKRNIEIFDGMREGWQDSKGEMAPVRLYQMLTGGLASFYVPYVLNRVGRAPTIDILPASVRSAIGWDTNPGYAAFEGVSVGATNNWATRTWPETGGVDWERDAFAQMLRRGEVDRIIDHWRKATQRMPLSHMLRPHNLVDAASPLWSIAWIVRPPEFPLMPQTHYFGGFQQLMDGGYWNSLDEQQIGVMLEAVRTLAEQAFAPGGTPDEQAKKLIYQDVLRPVLITMYMTRESPHHGARIQRFFDEESWLADLLTIDGEAVPVVEGRYRRKRRAQVRGEVGMPMERYDEHVREHAARKQSTALPPGSFSSFGGLQVVDSAGGETPTPPVEVDDSSGSAAFSIDAAAGTGATVTPVIVAPTTVPPTIVP